jgi:CRAL/TRIO domain
MIAQLSEEQVDIAAASSYHYECCLSSSSSRNATDEQKTNLEMLRKEYVMLLASRFWIAEKGNVKMALEKMQTHLQYRTDFKINLIRSCFTRRHFANDEEKLEAAEIRRKIRKFLLGPGDSGRVFHRGYDVDGRVCVHNIVINTPLHNRTDQEGYMESTIFILEKAIACSSKNARQKMQADSSSSSSNNNNLSPLRQRLDCLKMVASVDFADFEGWHTLPISVNRDLLHCLQNHYPETLHRMYFCDAPLLFRAVWTLLKPFIDVNTKAKFQFVTGGSAAKQAVFHNGIFSASQTMPYQRPDALLTSDVDMERYFSLPLDQAYDEE